MRRAACRLNPDRATLEPVLDTYVKLCEIYDLIVVLDKSGRFIASNITDPKGQSLNVETLSSIEYQKLDWFQHVIEKKFSDDEAKGFTDVYVSQPEKSEITSIVYKSERYGNIFATDFRDQNGEVIVLP